MVSAEGSYLNVKLVFRHTEASCAKSAKNRVGVNSQCLQEPVNILSFPKVRFCEHYWSTLAHRNQFIKCYLRTLRKTKKNWRLVACSLSYQAADPNQDVALCTVDAEARYTLENVAFQLIKLSYVGI